MSDRIAVGQIVRCVGLKGAVKIAPLTDDVRRFKGVRNVWIGNAERQSPYRVESSRVDATSAVLEFKEITNRSSAEKILEQYVFVDEKDAVRPRKGSFFAHEIIGMEVTTTEGRAIGVVEDIWKLPANDVWVVRSNKKEVLIPAVKSIVKRIELDQKRIVIEDLEGLMD